MADSKLTALSAITAPVSTDITYLVSDPGGSPAEKKMELSCITDYSVCNGRLTLETGVPVSTSDQTAKTTVYFTPYKGNRIGLYDGSATWTALSFTELSLSLSGYTANKNYDVWVYNNAETATLDSTIWTDDTTRATALALQDGIYVKTGATTRRYVGTIRITGTTGQCEDSVANRFVWNYYNQLPRKLLKRDATSHGYTTATWRSWNNDAALRVTYVIGAIEAPIWLSVAGEIDAADGSPVYTGLGVDITNNVTEYLYTNNGNVTVTRGGVSQDYYSAIGYHFVQIVQLGQTNAVFPDAMVAGHILG